MTAEPEDSERCLAGLPGEISELSDKSLASRLNSPLLFFRPRFLMNVSRFRTIPFDP
jgi:hypothetical protein